MAGINPVVTSLFVVCFFWGRERMEFNFYQNFTINLRITDNSRRLSGGPHRILNLSICFSGYRCLVAVVTISRCREFRLASMASMGCDRGDRYEIMSLTHLYLPK